MVDVTVVGMGSMGVPIAQNLMRAGFQVAVWNRDMSRADALVREGATVSCAPREGFSSPMVLSVLADDNAVAEVFTDEVLDAMGSGALHCNLGTISPALAEERGEQHARHQVGYVAAPMFGGVPVAEAGKLNIVTAGEPGALTRVEPFLAAISAARWPVGSHPRLANVVKVAGQLVIASVIQTLSEAVALAERGGIDGERLVEILTSTITPGPVYSNYGAMIAEQRYLPARFATPLGRKDVDLARAQAAATSLQLPVGDLLSDLLVQAVDAGHAEHDWASLADVQRSRDTGGDV
ncbi:NAD(P)-dependent oxidoreductase [Micrococcus luteus]|uniref:NAD(P)-dependent oxidoreductase n=1 Tax=Micrococcus luteus TaxID=1270 RepID=UPI000667F4A4|nr:NAD(P)-dependent oxidoreductase [Micrococcus luteus]